MSWKLALADLTFPAYVEICVYISQVIHGRGFARGLATIAERALARSVMS